MHWSVQGLRWFAAILVTSTVALYVNAETGSYFALLGVAAGAAVLAVVLNTRTVQGFAPWVRGRPMRFRSVYEAGDDLKDDLQAVADGTSGFDRASLSGRVRSWTSDFYALVDGEFLVAGPRIRAQLPNIDELAFSTAPDAEWAAHGVGVVDVYLKWVTRLAAHLDPLPGEQRPRIK